MNSDAQNTLQDQVSFEQSRIRILYATHCWLQDVDELIKG